MKGIELSWKIYHLTDYPFPTSQFIDMEDKDIRNNGRLFCKDIVEAEFKRLQEMLNLKSPVIYIGSGKSVLGLGKSALMAASYWQMIDAGLDALWINATGGYAMSPTLGRIIDEMVNKGYIKRIKDAVDTSSIDVLSNALSTVVQRPSKLKTSALQKILSVPDEEVAKKYANIRRSIRIYDTTDLFKYLLALLHSIGITHLYFFIDQFEEYIMGHTGAAGLRKLGDEVNDLFRSSSKFSTLVFPLHPDAQKLMQTAAMEYATTLAPLSENIIVLLPMSEENAVKMTKYFLDSFRDDESYKGSLIPFEETIVRYIAYKCEFNQRHFLSLLGRALQESRNIGRKQVDVEFVSKDENHRRIFGAVTNECDAFAKKTRGAVQSD